MIVNMFFLIDPSDFTDNVRDEFNRYDPDSTLNGFFPLWGVVILILSGILFIPYINIYMFVNLGFFLVIAACGFIGYLVGCRTPPDPHHHPSTDSTAPFFVIQNFRLTI
jgi:hypothetical protein